MAFGKIGARKMMYEWKNPYVTDGLIAMWDAEWNVGGGKHESAPMLWKDLSGNGIDMVSKGEPSFGANYMTASKLENLWYTNETDKMDSSIASGTFTIEQCCESTLGHSSQKSVIWGGGTTGQGAGILLQALDPTRCGCQGDIAGNGNIIKYGRASNLAVSGIYANGETYSVKYSDFLGVTFSGSAIITTLPISYISKRFTIVLRYTYQVDSASYGQKWHNIRVYSRALTTEEVEHNYAVDKKRFNPT